MIWTQWTLISKSYVGILLLISPNSKKTIRSLIKEARKVKWKANIKFILNPQNHLGLDDLIQMDQILLKLVMMDHLPCFPLQAIFPLVAI